MVGEAPVGQWIGPRPSRLQFSAVMFLGVTAIMIAGLQPLLLGTLAHEGRLTANQLGQAATAELLAMGLAAFVSGAVRKPAQLKLIGIAASLILAAIDFATPFVAGDAITLMRGLAGLPSGVLMWITIALIARTPTPERWSGVYLTVQTLAQFVVATILSATIVPSAARVLALKTRSKLLREQLTKALPAAMSRMCRLLPCRGTSLTTWKLSWRS